MKKNKFVIYGLLIDTKGRRVITETYQKDYCKLFAFIRWSRHHKHQHFLKCFRG